MRPPETSAASSDWFTAMPLRPTTPKAPAELDRRTTMASGLVALAPKGVALQALKASPP
jgi:hypothetical protein